MQIDAVILLTPRHALAKTAVLYLEQTCVCDHPHGFDIDLSIFIFKWDKALNKFPAIRQPYCAQPVDKLKRSTFEGCAKAKPCRNYYGQMTIR